MRHPRRPRILRSALVAFAAFAWVTAPAPAAARQRRPPSAVLLDGRRTDVRWVDGDTFRILDGAWSGRSVRLEGYNTLESYGPVHRWGSWRAPELLEIARAATAFVAVRAWTCSTRGREDRYRRLLVSCPDAAAELIRHGLAMVFAIDAPPDPSLVALQREAQRAGAGMWARGVPAHVVTSVHSAAEGGSGHAYDRIVDTATGATLQRSHARWYRTCAEVCFGTAADRSCMIYVPFERRYRGRPWCLRSRAPTQN